VAKKAKRKIEEAEESKFEFPVFDERAFVSHELELTWANLIAFGVAVTAAVLSTIGQRLLAPVVGLVIGIAFLIGGPLLIRGVRSKSSEYTKGDWAAIIAILFFAWLGLWFLFQSVLSAL
jgi:Na+(H+)/acetate symporter ActP